MYALIVKFEGKVFIGKKDFLSLNMVHVETDGMESWRFHSIIVYCLKFQSF